MSQKAFLLKNFEDLKAGNPNRLLNSLFKSRDGSAMQVFFNALAYLQLGQIVGRNVDVDKIVDDDVVNIAGDCLRLPKGTSGQQIFEKIQTLVLTENRELRQPIQMADAVLQLTDDQINRLKSIRTIQDASNFLDVYHASEYAVSDEFFIKVMLRRNMLDSLLHPIIDEKIKLFSYFDTEDKYNFELIQKYLLGHLSPTQQIASIAKIISRFDRSKQKQAALAVCGLQEITTEWAELSYRDIEKVWHHAAQSVKKSVQPPTEASPTFSAFKQVIIGRLQKAGQFIWGEPNAILDAYQVSHPELIQFLAVANQVSFLEPQEISALAEKSPLVLLFSKLRMKLLKHLIATQSSQLSEIPIELIAVYMVEFGSESELNYVQSVLPDIQAFLLDAIAMAFCPTSALNRIVGQTANSLETLKSVYGTLTKPCRSFRVNCVDSVVKNAVEELYARFNKSNAQEFQQALLLLSVRAPVTIARELVYLLMATDLTNDLGEIVKATSENFQHIVIMHLLACLNQCVTDEINNGGLSTMGKKIACITMDLIFTLDPSRFYTLLNEMIVRMTKRGSYLFLFLFRELLAYVFAKATGKVKDRSKINYSLQMDNDALVEFQSVSARSCYPYFKSLCSYPNTIIKLLSQLRPHHYSALLLKEKIKFDELTNLLTQTRNDFLYFLSLVEMDQPWIGQQLQLINQCGDSANVVMYKAVLLNKQERPVEAQTKSLSYMLMDQSRNKLDGEVYRFFLSDIQDANQATKYYFIFQTAPQLFHESITSFIAGVVRDWSDKALFNLMRFSYTSALSFTKQDADRFANLITQLMQAHVGSALLQRLLIFHSYLCSNLYKKSYAPALLELHAQLQAHSFGEDEDKLMAATSYLMVETSAEMEDGINPLIKVVTYRLKQAIAGVTVDEHQMNVAVLFDVLDLEVIAGMRTELLREYFIARLSQ